MNQLSYGQRPIESFTEDFYAISKNNIKDVNSLNFRSDEFTNKHKGKHIVFSGCSNTFGVGLEKEELWAWKTYKKIIKNEECSGFFNLGVGGTGIMHMVINIFKYCKKYGNPDVIFINLSNQNRMFHYVTGYYKLKFDDNDNEHNIKLLNYQYYFMLEQYCNSNKIKLYSFTWDHHGFPGENTNSLFKKYNFKTFYSYDLKILLENLKKLEEQTDDKYFMVARDGKHQGTGYHSFWSDFIYEKYVNDNTRS
jgi:hypothetical protein